MKNKLHTIFSIALMVLSVNASKAQDSKFNLRFKSGEVSLTENISAYNSQGNYTFNGLNYIIIQFSSVPTNEQKEQLKNADVRLINYMPNLSYVASVPVTVDKSILINAGVRAYYILTVEQKMEKNLFHAIVPQWAKSGNDFADVDVALMDAFTFDKLIPSLTAMNAFILSEKNEYKIISVRVPIINLKQLAMQPWLMWMEPKAEPFVGDNLAGKAGHRSFILNDGIRNLSGQGVAVGAWESADVAKHVDLYGRFKQEEITGGSTSGSGGQHATEVTGIFVGGGLKDPNARGMAPNAFLYGHNFTSGNVETELQNVISNYNVIIGNHAYGTTAPAAGCTGDPYGLIANVRDLFLNSNPEFINCYSAGNYQTSSSCIGYFTTNSKAEKNTIVVGAVTNTDVMTSYSSWGPVEDYRVKPDLVGIGDGVVSTYPNHGYSGALNGTSFSTPGVAGVCAQLVQRYRQLNGNTNPKNNLIKAVLCNTAKDLGNAGPDYKHGYGRINALRAVRALEQNRYKIDSVANAASKTVSITVPANTAALKVMITWNDPAAIAFSIPALVNDLNMSVIDPSAVSWNPWVLNGGTPSAVATRAVDALNNIEQVTIANPAAGSYQIKVDGFAVTVGNAQAYSITWEIDPSYIEVVYPAGNEKLKGGVLETIRWDKEGVTGTQTVEYSSNGGVSWNVISSSVAAGTSHYNWSVPNSVQTSNAMVRVSSGSLSDTSDYKFTIVGVPGGVTAADDPCGVLISWTAVTGATGYDVMLLDTVIGVWNVAGSNVSGTSYAVGGLTVGTRYWFTVRARNVSLGITGQRAVAINKINNNAGVTPTITVNGNILSTQTATTYQWLLNGVVISGATSINYTVTQPGNYSVIVTNSSGCAATSLPIVFVFTGLENQGTANLFSIYPNPNNGVFQFEMNNQEENTTLVITNAIGQQLKVIQFEISSIHETIDLSRFDNGVYFVTLISGKTFETKKIIVNK